MDSVILVRSARTFLFVPGDRPERFAKALASPADAVVLDLEDAVAQPAKDSARAAVAQALRDASDDERARLVVRINDEAAAAFAEDLAMLAECAASGAAAVMLPKAERVATLERLAAACPGMAMLALVESARGVLAAESLAAAPGVVRLVFGTLDFALDIGAETDAGPTSRTGVTAASDLQHLALDAAASRLVWASRAAGIAAPVAGVTTAIDDEPLLLAELARARAHGFSGKLCIHPRQVEPIHAAFRPGAEPLAQARRVLQAAEAAAGAAVLLDGRMVDKPVIERARRLVARATR